MKGEKIESFHQTTGEVLNCQNETIPVPHFNCARELRTKGLCPVRDMICGNLRCPSASAHA